MSLAPSYRGGARWALYDYLYLGERTRRSLVLILYIAIRISIVACPWPQLYVKKLDGRLCSASILRGVTRHSLIVVLYLAWKSSSGVYRLRLAIVEALDGRYTIIFI